MMIDQLLNDACNLLENEQSFILASIISHRGATPRTAGTKMIVTKDGRGIGTIGGGLLEARVMKKAVDILSGKNSSTFMPFDLNHDDKASMDMICGGKALVLMDKIVFSNENADLFERWKKGVKNRENGYFLTIVSGSVQKIDKISHCITDADKNRHGAINLPSDVLDKISVEAENSNSMKVVKIEDITVIIEPIVNPKVAWFFGAGHVAQPTVHLASMTGFRTLVQDDRAEFANRKRFPDADEIRVLKDFATAFDDISIDSNSYIVIFTRGHLHDQAVLTQALETDACYIGMIGSQKKRETIYRSLLDAGFEQKDIDRVHSPIGLAIEAETCEEIAVSIVGEMIAHRAKKKRDESG